MERQSNIAQWAVPAVIAVGLYFAYDALFGDEQPGGDAPPLPEDEADPRPATLTLSRANQLADQIEVAVHGSAPVQTPWEDDEAFAAALMQCEVTADVRLLMNTYGERGTILSPLSLSETVAAYLDEDYIAAVNADYLSKGIAIQW